MAAYKASEKARKAAKRGPTRERALRIYPIVKVALLDLLGELGPCIDPDLVDAYLERARARGWPDVSPSTVRATRSRLTAAGQIAAVGSAINPTTGRMVRLWGLSEGTEGTPTGRKPMWDDE